MRGSGCLDFEFVSVLQVMSLRALPTHRNSGAACAGETAAATEVEYQGLRLVCKECLIIAVRHSCRYLVAETGRLGNEDNSLSNLPALMKPGGSAMTPARKSTPVIAEPILGISAYQRRSRSRHACSLGRARTGDTC